MKISVDENGNAVYNVDMIVWVGYGIPVDTLGIFSTYL